MDGFLILMEASAACAIAALTAKKAELWYEQHHPSKYRKHLLSQALHESDGDLSTTRNLHLSDRQIEMELLLMHLSGKTELLTGALAAELKCGQTAAAEDTESSFVQWREARRRVEQAQEFYSEALESYDEFLHTLPPPLRAKAVQRGAVAMAMNPA